MIKPPPIPPPTPPPTAAPVEDDLCDLAGVVTDAEPGGSP